MNFRRAKIRAVIAMFAFGIALPKNVEAAILLSDNFNSYPVGAIVGASGSPWVTASGTAGQVDVTSGGALNITASESEDIGANFPDGTVTTGMIYGGFDFTFSALPTTAGTYFAHFGDAGTGTQFRGRIFATTAGAAAGTFRLAIADTTTTVAPITTDLLLGTTYRLVEAINAATGRTTLYLNPTSETGGVTATDATSAIGSGVASYRFRQASGEGTLTVDNLVVATDFNSAAGIVGGGSVILGAVAANSGAFGNNLLLGATVTTTVTLTNSGTAATTDITGSAVTGFTIGAPASGTVAAGGGTTTSTVSVDTSTAGVKSGNLTYTANPGAVVSTPTIALSAEVNTATYGATMSAATPASYTTGAGSLSSTGNGTATGGTPIALHSTATILSYTNSTGIDTAVNMTWRTRTAAEASDQETLEGGGTNTGGVTGSYLISDIVNLTGMQNSGSSSLTDVFTLEMTYDESLLNGFETDGVAHGTIYIAWNNNGNWVNAVTGNSTTASNYKGAIAPTGVLGDYGIIPGSNTVWAVLDHNSEFAVIPEPSTMVLGGIAMLGFAGFGLRRRRKQTA